MGARYDASRVETDASARFGAARRRDFGDVSGSVGLNVPFGRGWSVGVSAARAVRAPTVEELYSDGFHAAVGAFDRGDPGLRPEVNRGVDAIVRAQSERLTMQVAGYLNRIDRYIAPALLGDTTILVEHDGGEEELTVPLNAFAQQDATLRGVEGMVETTVNGHWVLGAMGDLVRGRFADGSPIPFMPQARLGGSVRWSDGRWSAGSTVRHAFRQDAAAARAAADETVAGSYTLVNLDLGLTIVGGRRAHSVTLRVDNLLDERYREATSRIKRYALNPGRNLAVVYRVLY
jgi:iron complex outermembrane receptor protein